MLNWHSTGTRRNCTDYSENFIVVHCFTLLNCRLCYVIARRWKIKCVAIFQKTNELECMCAIYLAN